MAKTDVNLYFLQVQEQYFEMLSNVNEFKELYQQGLIPDEAYQQMLKETELLKSNYERLSYVMLELQKPRRKKKAKKAEELDDYTRGYYDALDLSKASKQAVLDENADILKDFRKYIDEGRRNINGNSN